MEEKKPDKPFVLSLDQWMVVLIITIFIVIAVAIPPGPEPEEPEYLLVLTTDKTEYNRGDTINITGVLTYGGDPVEGKTIGVMVPFLVPHADQVKTNSDGYFTSKAYIPYSNPTGPYVITAAVSGLGVSNTTNFTLVSDGAGTAMT